MSRLNKSSKVFLWVSNWLIGAISVVIKYQPGDHTESLPWPRQALRIERSMKPHVSDYTDPHPKYALQCNVVSEGTAAWFDVVLRLEAPCFSSSWICAVQGGRNLSIVFPGLALARHETSCPTA